MTTTGKARPKAAPKDLELNVAHDVKGGKKTAAQRQAEFERLVGDNQVTADEHWNIH